MKITRILLLAGIVLWGHAQSFGQSIVWNGNGDGTSWSNPQNWVGQQAPGPANKVFITNGAGSTVVISSAVTVQSILCGKALSISGGSLELTSGTSSLQGALILSSGTALSASGSGTTLTSSGSVNADGADFNISAGAVVTLPALQNYDGACVRFAWTVTGPDTVLNLPGLTNMTQANCGSGGHIEAETGGQISAPNLVSIDEEGYLETVQADGPNSLVDFSGLETVSGAFAVTFEASGGGTNLVPFLLGGANAAVSLNPGGTLPVGQIKQLGGITVNGVTNDFSSLTIFDGGNVSLNGGAIVTLPVLRNYSGLCTRFAWTVVGPDTVLNLPALTNMTEPECGFGGAIQAEAGGQIWATNLMSIDQEGYAETVQADGTNSLVNFSGLETVSGAYSVTFEASGGGTNLVSHLMGGPNAYVALYPGGTVSVAQIQQLDGIIASNITVNFASLVNFDGGNVSLSGGAAVTLPALQNYSGLCTRFNWTVAGPGTVLNLPALTNMTEPECGFGGIIQAEAGGQIWATNLMSIDQEGYAETVQADGTNSLVNFSGLETVSGAYSVTFEASGGGTNLVSHLVGGPNAYVALYPGGTVSVAQIQQLGGIIASNVTVNFPSLVNFDGGNVSLNGGAAVTLPALRNYSGGCGHFIWMVVGPKSVLNLSGLTNMTQPYCGSGGQIEAEAGGQIWAANLVSIDEEGDPETVQADGTNSLVNFGSLETVSGAFIVNFEASDGGTNWVPHILDGTNASLTINPGGTVPVAQIPQLRGIIASNVTINFPSLVSFDGGNVSLSGGAAVTLPELRNFSGGCDRFNWTVIGPHSVLNLPVLTNITGPYCGFGGQIEAQAGGQIWATNLATMDQEGDPEYVQADGTNSLVDFSGLQSDSGPYPITFEASQGGTNWVPQFIGGPNVYVTLNAGGALPVALMRQLRGITVSNATADFTSLSSFDGASISVSGGAVVTMAALGSYATPNNPALWQITDPGSVLNLPALTNLLGSYCCPFNLETLAGAQLLLDHLTDIQDGNVSFLSDGTGSVINLSQLSRFVISLGTGQLTAQNNGTILFDNQPFLLSNVAINIPAGNPILPPTLIASSTLTLCGKAWDSYRVEERNTLVPGSPALVLLIPMTNSFQAIASAAPSDTAFLITDFVANPPILQMELTPDSQTQLVLYGLTNATYQIQSTTNLGAPLHWTPGSVAAMTNAFRIFPAAPPAAAWQFYRAEQE